MKSYKKICRNCGNVYFSSRSHSTTCSQKCRTQLHYKLRYGKQTVQTTGHTCVKTFEHLNAEMFNGFSNGDHANAKNQMLKRFNGVSNGINVLTDDSLYDISVHPWRKVEAYMEEGYQNYFVDSIYHAPTIQTLMFKGGYYHFIGFFEDEELVFEKFHTEIAFKQTEFIFLESDIEFYDEWEDSIMIYVHEKLFNLVVNNSALADIYGFVRCSPDENRFVYYHAQTDQYLLKTGAEQ